MTLPMIIALAVTVLMIVLIMIDKLPFGAPPLLACLLLAVFGVVDLKTAFGGFSNPTIIMLASFMAIIAADKRVMGAYRSRIVSRVLIWVTVGIVTVLTAVLLVMQVLGI